MLSNRVLTEVMQCYKGGKYMNIQSNLLGQPAMLIRLKVDIWSLLSSLISDTAVE
jgi:hypothetical protein